MKKVWQLLEEGFTKVTTNTINGIIKKAIKEEDSF